MSVERILPRLAAGETSPTAERIAAAVADGRCGRLFPPVATTRGEYASQVRRLAGPADAAFVADTLSHPRFRPFVHAIDRVTRWSRTADDELSAPDVWSIDNDALFGPLLVELFTVCAAQRMKDIDIYCRQRVAGRLRHLDTFQDRLRSDRDLLRERFGLTLPIVSVTVHGNETHNGGRQVLRVADAEGRAVAYKARPVHGEALFTASEEGLFALINALAGEDLLPTLSCLSRGSGASAWLWQEWVEPAPAEQALHENGVTVAGPVIDTKEAPRFWRRAGALAAAAHAFGIGDLIEGNIVAGLSNIDEEPRYHVVDLEVFGNRVGRLSETGLVAGTGPLHHVGFENRPRLCTVDPPMAYFDDDMHLVRLNRSWARERTDTVVSDSDGRFGYGAYLPEFVGGAFDIQATLCGHREDLAKELTRRYDGAAARVLPRDTAEYVHALEQLVLDGREPDDGFTETERSQLLAGDVPYFYVTAEDSRVRTLDGIVARSDEERFVGTEDWDLGALGVVLRDAKEFAGLTATVRRHGVRIGHHEIAVDWADVDSRLIYTWTDDTVRLQVAEPTPPEDVDEVAAQLVRIDRADAALRTAWVDGARQDTALATQLSQLCEEAGLWLESVVDAHGWPTAATVGEEAADAACRLLQHMSGATEFRRRCLREMATAAEHGDVPLKDVAYTTDAVRLSDGEPQLYGTKFELREGRFVPCLLADADDVDTRRAAMGLPPLAEYAETIRRRFATTIDPGAAS
ncbi:MAG TPA: type 2 lantipeptide synthetase LanM [Candidatus Stackebrandtia excrementipullorum]|nr:type 2 lantipeptide synthetase LanM [Candidatus Stackebrandtia excrementipullorum]